MPDDTLTEMLVSQGLITLAQRRQADALAQQQRVTASHALIELGFFTAEDMETLVSTHIRNRLMGSSKSVTARAVLGSQVLQIEILIKPRTGAATKT